MIHISSQNFLILIIDFIVIIFCGDYVKIYTANSFFIFFNFVHPCLSLQKGVQIYELRILSIHFISAVL